MISWIKQNGEMSSILYWLYCLEFGSKTDIVFRKWQVCPKNKKISFIRYFFFLSLSAISHLWLKPWMRYFHVLWKVEYPLWYHWWGKLRSVTSEKTLNQSWLSSQGKCDFLRTLSEFIYKQLKQKIVSSLWHNRSLTTILVQSFSHAPFLPPLEQTGGSRACWGLADHWPGSNWGFDPREAVFHLLETSRRGEDTSLRYEYSVTLHFACV